MTLTGTRTYVLGEHRVIVIDPGSMVGSHIDAIAQAVGGATVEGVVLTHLHPDHEEGADELADRLSATVLALGRGTLGDGDRIVTDAGDVIALHAPGHTPDHTVLHWPAGVAVFCGDLMMGGLDTALVAPPEGDLRAYLTSLAMIGALRPAVLHPAHGPSFEDPDSAIDMYVRHRRQRLEQVLRAVDAEVGPMEEIVARVYGDTIPEALRGAAAGAVLAYLEYLEAEGRVERGRGGWTLSTPSTPM
jgi:glyoxylase-like metal-dependent hydrolase (beta-lactamase superfamily II)